MSRQQAMELIEAAAAELGQMVAFEVCVGDEPGDGESFEVTNDEAEGA